MSLKIALMPGDGIGPEVTEEAVRILKNVAEHSGKSVTFTSHRIGGTAIDTDGMGLPEATLEAALGADAVLLGAVGHPKFDGRMPADRPEAALLALRQALGGFANLRPAISYPSLAKRTAFQPERVKGANLLIIRELLGGLYYGEPREWNRATDASVNTMRYSRSEIDRVARVAFELARGRRRKVVSVDKANVLETSQLWRAVVIDVAKDFPDVQLSHEYVDACAMKLACAPSSFDVLLTENLFGDILSDEAGAICGSLGMLPSASLGNGPGLFEPVHGSAPAIAGKQLANPCGAILSAAMMLRSSLRLQAPADAIEQSVAETLAAGLRTADIAPPGAPIVNTSTFTDVVIARLRV